MNVFDEMGNYWAEIADQNSTDRQTHGKMDAFSVF
jgi:hypothetical protein